MPRVLLVDDDPSILRTSRDLLVVADVAGEADVFTARDPDAARELLGARSFAVVTSDFNLGARETGADVLRAVMRLQPCARRVLASGDDPEAHRALLDAGIVHAFVAKDARPGAFLALMQDEITRSSRDHDVEHLLCIACRHAFFAAGHAALACPACGGRRMRGFASAGTGSGASRSDAGLG